MQRKIIVSGCGGLHTQNPFLDAYILAQSNKENPKICLLPTASADSSYIVKEFYQIYQSLPCDPSHLSLFNPHTSHIEDFIMSQDIIFVSGGHSKNMMGIWKEWGVDKYLKQAYENGTILSGGSAGSVCWFDQCITDSIPKDLTVMNCLGFLPYSNCPHFASGTRRQSYLKHLQQGTIKPGYAACDFAALHFVDEKLFRSVSIDKKMRCYEGVINPSKDDPTKMTASLVRIPTFSIQENQKEFIWDTPTFAAYTNQATVEEESPVLVEESVQ